MSRPTTFENTLRLFDNAIEQWLGGIEINYGTANKQLSQRRSILIVQAKPERAFAQVQNLLITKGWMKSEDLSIKDLNTFPLPIAAISRIGMFTDNLRANAAGRYPNLVLDCVTKQILGADYPTPVNIMYEVNFWCLKDFTENHISEWIHAQLGRRGASPSEFYITVQHEIDPVTGIDIYGSKLHSCRFEAWADMTVMDEYDPAKAYRFRRWNLTLTLRAWIMHSLDGEDAPKMALQIDQDLVREGDRGTLAFYQAPIQLGQCSTVANLLDVLDKSHRSSRIFTLSDGVTAADGIGQAPQKNRTPTYDITIPATGGTVQTRDNTPLPLLSLGYDVPLRIHFKYLPITITDLYLETLRVSMVAGGKYSKPQPQYEVVQHWDLGIIVPGKWSRFEGFATEESWAAFRIGSVAGGRFLLGDVVAQFHEADLRPTEVVADNDMAAVGVTDWTPIGGASLSKATPAAGGSQYLEVIAGAGGGFFQNVTLTDSAIYALLRINLLNVIGEWSIILDNDAVSPTSSETVVIDENWKEVGLITTPKPLSDTLRIRIVANTASARLDVETISVRGYVGQFNGTKVPM